MAQKALIKEMWRLKFLGDHGKRKDQRKTAE
jgi:hypothetical protein